MMEAIHKFTALKHKKRNLVESSDDEHNELVKKQLLKDNQAGAAKLEVDRLFDNVDKPIEFASTHPFYPPPKDFIYNVAGVSANPGSREFHAYRAARRKEYGRLKTIEVDGQQEQVRKEFQDNLDAVKATEDEKTAKKREKRLKRKKGKGNSKTKKDASDSVDED